MAEIATLVLGADAAGLLKGEAALNSIVKKAESTEARVAVAMDGIADAMTGTGTAATTSAKVIATADTSKARSADLAAQAIKAATATETLARNAAATAATTSATQVVSAVQAVGKQSSFAAGGGVRMLGQQLSQVAQQGAVTGNYLGALAVQLPDMALGFGNVAVAASIVATVTLPLLINAMGGSEMQAEKLKDAIGTLDDAIASSDAAAKLAAGDFGDLAEKYGLVTPQVLALADAMRQMSLRELADSAKTVKSQLTGMFSDGWTSDLEDMSSALDLGTKASQHMGAALDYLRQNSNLSLDDQIAQLAAMRTDFEGMVGPVTQMTDAQLQFWSSLVDSEAALSRVRERTKELSAPIADAAAETARWHQNLAGAYALYAQTRTTADQVAAAARLAANDTGRWEQKLSGAYNLYAQTRMQADASVGATNGLVTGLSSALDVLARLSGAQPGASFLSTAIARASTLRSTLYGAYEAALKAMAAATTPDLAGPAGMGDSTTAFASETAKKLAAAEAAAEAYRRRIIEIPAAADAAGAASSAAADAATTALTDAEQAAKDYADALNAPVISAVDGIANAWGSFVAGGLQDFKGLVKGVLGSFQKMLADMITMSLRNKILVSLGLGASATGGASAATAAGSMPFGQAMMGGGLGQSFGALGGMVGLGAPAAGAATGFMAALPAIGIIAGGISLLAGLFARTQTGAGITGTYSDAGFSGSSYSTSKNAFGSRTSTTAISGATASGIAATLGDLRGSVVDMAGTLNIGADALAGFSASIKVSTFGMSADQKAKAIEAALMQVGDNMAGLLLATDVYAKQGETQLATLTRLSQALPQVNNVLAMLGDEVYAVGLTGADAASKLADAFGGLEAMATASKTYFDLFFSDAEKLAANTQAVQSAFAKLGVAMPGTRDGYRALVAAQDLSTEAGRALYAALVSMAGAMDQVLPIAGQLAQAIAQLVSSAGGQLDGMISETESAMNAAESAAAQWYSAAKNLRDYIADLRGAKSDLASAEATRAYNETRFQMLLAQAMSGSQSAYKDLTGAASALLSSTTDSASTAVEAAIQQARIIADLNKAANVADIGGAKNDVVAGLLGKQRDLLVTIRNYLAGGGVLDPAHIDALNGQLGALQGAIADAQAIDYAQVVASLDVTATLISKVDDPALKALLENAAHEIEGTVAFVADTEGLTPAQRFLALHNATSHTRTIELLADGSAITPQNAALALAVSSSVNKTIIATLQSTMSDQDKELALAVSGDITRSINAILGSNLDQDAMSLALETDRDIIRTVDAILKPGRLDSYGVKVGLATSSNLLRSVDAVLLSGRVDSYGVRVALADSRGLLRTVNAVLATGTQGSAALDLALAASQQITKTIIGEIDLSKLTTDQKTLLAAISSATGSTLTLGGSFLWDPSTGFQTWLEETTQGNIANPLNALVAPMVALRSELSILAAEIRVQNAADEAARAAAIEAAAKAKAIADAQAVLSGAAAARAAAGAQASSAVAAVTEFDKANGGYLSRADGSATQLTLNPDGTLNYNGATGVKGTQSEIANWMAKFYATGGLRDQAKAASLAQIEAEKALQAARDQVLALGGVPAFARGGMHAGGFRIVGERGPELEATGAARIYSANDTARMVGGNDAQMVAELRRLRDEVKKLRDQHHEFASKDAVLQRRQAKLMEAWDADGLLTRT